MINIFLEVLSVTLEQFSIERLNTKNQSHGSDWSHRTQRSMKYWPRLSRLTLPPPFITHPQSPHLTKRQAGELNLKIPDNTYCIRTSFSVWALEVVLQRHNVINKGWYGTRNVSDNYKECIIWLGISSGICATTINSQQFYSMQKNMKISPFYFDVREEQIYGIFKSTGVRIR